MTRREVERIVDAAVARAAVALERRMVERLDELAGELRDELDTLDRRLTTTHREALKAATRLIERRTHP